MYVPNILIQDMAVPAHVRNDFKSHLDRVGITWEILFKPTKWFGDKFEYFVAKHREWITGSDGGNLTEPTLTRFWDTDNYDGQNPSISLSSPLIGLAEYTNINFASKNTVFAEDLPSNDVHYNPYPRKSSTNVQKYIDGDMLPKIVIGEDNVPDTSFYLNLARIDEEIERNHLGFLVLLDLRKHRPIMRRYPDGKRQATKYQEKAQW
jgi:hypothetical protein